MNPEPLDALDAAFLAAETPTMPLHVVAVAVLQPGHGGCGAAQVRDVLADRIGGMPRLRRRVLRVPFGADHPLWVDVPDLDLDRHLVRASLPPPGGPPELAAFLGDLAARPLDPDQPLWQLTVVEGLESGHVALVAKVHHCLFDGVSGIAAFAGLFDATPRGARTGAQGGEAGAPSDAAERGAATSAGPASAGDGSSPAEASLTGLAASVARRWSRRPVAVADTVASTYLALRQLVAEHRGAAAAASGSVPGAHGEPSPPGPPSPGDAGTAPAGPPAPQPGPLPFRVPRAPWNGTISAARRCALVAFPLEDLLAVRAALGGTVNDVLLAAVGGALRPLLEVPDGGRAAGLAAMVPVSVRPAGPAGERHGNRVTATMMPIGTDVDGPAERLAAVAAASAAAKRRAGLVGEEVVRGWSELAVPALLSRLTRVAANLRVFDRLPPAANVMVSNVAGPAAALYLGDARVVALFPFGPVADGIGLNVSALSYGGTMHVGLIACRDRLPDLDGVATGLRDAVTDLVKQAAAPRRSGASRQP